MGHAHFVSHEYGPDSKIGILMNSLTLVTVSSLPRQSEIMEHCHITSDIIGAFGSVSGLKKASLPVPYLRRN